MPLLCMTKDRQIFCIHDNRHRKDCTADHKYLPVVVKNYKETGPKSVIIYIGPYFGIFPFLEFLQLYAECTLEVRRLLDSILTKV